MTRLRKEDISEINVTLEGFNRQLVKTTGHTLDQIAAYAVGVSAGKPIPEGIRVAVIPMTCGQGIIEGFSSTVAGIVKFLGFQTFVTQTTDAAGLAEAVEKGANIIMVADDNRFVAISLKTHKVSDNSEATGRGFAAALDLMTGGLRGQDILVLGAGPVGLSAAVTMAGYGGHVSVFDVNLSAANRLAEELLIRHHYQVTIQTDLDFALDKHRIIYDATPVKGLITERHVDAKTFIAAPGVPLGVDDKCLPLVENRILHDPLQIGVATMIYDVIS